MEVIGKKIRKAREGTNLSIEQLAARTSITYSYLSQIEHGKRKGVSLAIIMRISEALRVPIAALVGEDEIISEAAKAIQQIQKILKQEGSK